MCFLEKKGYTYNKVLGQGGFSTEEELEYFDYNKIAAKIMLQEYISDGEMDIWPKLNHENIFPVLKV